MLVASEGKSAMALFGRKKKRDGAESISPSTPPAPPGVPAAAYATGDFDVLVRALITQMSGHEVVEVGDDTVSTDGNQCYLGNLRAHWNQREPGEREIWLRNAIHGFHLSALRDMATLDTSMLRPGIRSRFADEHLRVMSAAALGEFPGPEPVLAWRPMSDVCIRVLIWDTPTTMSLVNQAQLDEWGADFDDLWEIALVNLAHDPVEQRAWATIEGCCRMAIPADDYSAERLLIDGYLDTTGIEGDIVLFHPARTVAIVADPADPRSIEIAAGLAIKHANDPYPVSLDAIVGRGTDWRPLSITRDHPAAEAVFQLRVAERHRLYANQADLITRAYGDNGVFPAKLASYESASGVMEIGTWTNTVDTLLPRSTHVGFASVEEEWSFVVPWDAAVGIVGHRMEPTHLYPERIRVHTFPDEGELAQLRAHDISQGG